MALATTLVPGGQHHAVTTGSIVAGSGFGEVSGTGPSQLCRFLLPFPPEIWKAPGFEDQFYVFFRSDDGGISNAQIDATPFELDSSGTQKILRLLLDVDRLPSQVRIWFESHHSAGR